MYEQLIEVARTILFGNGEVMMGLAPLVALGIGAGVGALGGISKASRSGKPTTTTTDMTTTKTPYGPTVDDLEYIMQQQRALYDNPNQATMGGPPSRDYSHMWELLGQSQPGAGQQRGGSGTQSYTQQGLSPSAAVSRGAAASPPAARSSGDAALENLYNKSLEDNPLLQTGSDFITRGLGTDLMPYVQDYMSGGDIAAGSDMSQRVADAYGPRFARQLEEQLGAVGNEADLAGMYGGTGRALQASDTDARVREMLTEKMLQAEMGVRGQNIGLLQGTMGWQSGLSGQIPGMEQARFIGPEAAARARLQEKDTAMKQTVAKIQAAAQRAAANISASASRYGSDRAYASSANALAQRTKEWSFQAAQGLTDKSFDDDLREWGYHQGIDQQRIDEYLNTTKQIAGLGGTSHEQGTGTTRGPKVNPLTGAIEGAVGGGLGAFGAFA